MALTPSNTRGFVTGLQSNSKGPAMHIKITGNAMSIVNLSNARFNLFLLLLCVNKDFIYITNS
ncbi:hypothetical protein, partial [Enterobacter hormaechei]|uniref:hypothetical protein n=1 Tax=Enterobacter hormaechei TaxID=158836 RepID=UPI003D6E73D7